MVMARFLKRLCAGNLVLYRTRSRDNRLSITFDDGPDPDLTPRVLQILGHTQHRATFFVIGDRVERYPQLLEQIAAAGHEIGNHSYSHPLDFGKLGIGEVARQIEAADAQIERVVGRRPYFFRPPLGCVTLSLLRYLSRESRLPAVLWSHVPGGNQLIFDRSAERLIRDVQHRRFVAGDILLMHDSSKSSVEGLSALLERLDQLSLVSACLGELALSSWGQR
jgi:peptidoglycan/xylan/chitin deacetylase (PgdA/CDA1 family)